MEWSVEAVPENEIIHGLVCEKCGAPVQEDDVAQCETCHEYFCPECSDDYEFCAMCLECKNEELAKEDDGI